MSALFDELENKVRSLTLREKATLARILIEELDPSAEAEIEQLWINEAQRRYEDYLKGDIEALPGDDVMAQTRTYLEHGKN